MDTAHGHGLDPIGPFVQPCDHRLVEARMSLSGFLLELRNEGRGTPKTPKGERKHLMTTAEVWSTMVS